MNEENNEKLPPVEADVESPAPVKQDKVELPAEFVAARADKAAWKSGKGPGRWATIGCGLGVVVLIVALFAGSSLTRKTVWAGFAGANQRVVNNLPGGLSPGERMRLTNNLDRFSVYLNKHPEPFSIMGEFQALVRQAFEDRQLSIEEVEELNLFVEAKLAEGGLAVPYSMPPGVRSEE